MNLSRPSVAVFVWLAHLLIFAVSCETSAPGSSQRVLLPWPDKTGEYSLQEVEISGLRDPYTLSSEAVSVHYNDHDSAVVRPRFVQDETGLIIPSDANSALAYAVFAHFSRFKQREDLWGVSALTKWPKLVAIDVRSEKNENNAFYQSLQQGGAIGVRQHLGFDLPIAFNQGVLAHEHFHSYFDELILKKFSPLTETSSKVEVKNKNFGKLTVDKNKLTAAVYNRKYVFRVWNEGLADFLGFTYSRDHNYIHKSLPRHAQLRTLTQPELPLVSSESFISLITGRARSLSLYDSRSQATKGTIVKVNCAADACSYILGTQIARLLHRLSSNNPQWAESNRDAHEVLAVHILSRLSTFAEVLQPLYENSYMPMGLLLKHIFEESRFVSDISCEELHMMTISSGLKEPIVGCRP